MAWIKWNCGLEGRPEVVAMSRELRKDRIHIAGCCMVCWAWGDRELRDGRAEGIPPEFLNELTGVKRFANAMEAVGWIRREGSGFCFVDWEHHNSRSAKDRAMDASLKNRTRPGHDPDKKPDTTRTENRTQTGHEPDQIREEKIIKYPPNPPGRGVPLLKRKDREGIPQAVIDEARVTATMSDEQFAVYRASKNGATH